MDLEQKAFERLRQGELFSKTYYQKPLMITYSGGKDSDVLAELALRSGIDFEIVHSHTTADAPETYRYINERFKHFEDKGIKCSRVYPTYKGKRASMWSLIVDKKMPPTRLVRYCCEILKETSGKNRVAATGVRWAESSKRKNGRGIYEDMNHNKDKRIFLMTDNDEKRQLIERCKIQAKIVVNPVIDWTDKDVWDYLRDCKCESNPLYQCGFTRVGCIGCPLAGKRQYSEFNRYPKYKDLYISAFDRMIQQDQSRYSWKNGHECFEWWMGEDPNQIKLF